MDSENEEEDFPTAELDDPVWSEEPVPNRWQQLCIHQIPYHTPRPVTQPLQPIQEDVFPEPEQIDINILDDLLDIINVPKELDGLLDIINVPKELDDLLDIINVPKELYSHCAQKPMVKWHFYLATKHPWVKIINRH